MSNEKERLIILQMLKDGTITEDEALRLLDAIKTGNTKEESTWEDSIRRIVRSVVDSSIQVGQKLDDWVTENVDLSFIDKQADKEPTQILLTENTVGISDLVFEVTDTNASINIDTWNSELIQVEAKLSTRSDEKLKDPIELTKYGNKIVLLPSKELAESVYSVRYDITLPKTKMDLIDIDIVNGHITIDNINAKKTSLESTNGRINIMNSIIDTLQINSTNGSSAIEATTCSDIAVENSNGNINLKNTTIDNALLKTINGKINIDGHDGDKISAETVYGSSTIKGLSSSLKNLDVKSENGNVYLFVTEDNSPLKAITCSNNEKSDPQDNLTSELLINFITDGASVSAYSEDYSESEDHLLINLNTTNGKIRIS